MDQIIEELKRSKFYKILQETDGDEIICIYIGGSRVYGLQDDDSDYDINVVCRHYHEPAKECLCYDDHVVIEWFNNNLDDYKLKSVDQLLSATRNFGMNYITDDVIIYKGPHADELLSLRNNNKIDGVDSGLINTYKILKTDVVLPILAGQEKRLASVDTKAVYHLCVGYHYLTNTLMNKDFIMQIKKMQYYELPLEVKQYVVNCLNGLSRFIK